MSKENTIVWVPGCTQSQTARMTDMSYLCQRLLHYTFEMCEVTIGWCRWWNSACHLSRNIVMRVLLHFDLSNALLVWMDAYALCVCILQTDYIIQVPEKVRTGDFFVKHATLRTRQSRGDRLFMPQRVGDEILLFWYLCSCSCRHRLNFGDVMKMYCIYMADNEIKGISHLVTHYTTRLQKG